MNTTKIKIPKPTTYVIYYQKGDSKSYYLVSSPIKATKDLITCYAFNRGIRSFKVDKILSMDKVVEA